MIEWPVHNLEGCAPMKRLFSALVLALLLAGLTPAQEAKKLTLRWHGQSFFDLTTSAGTKIVFDPHAIEVFGRPMLKADAICISHLHDDHTQFGVIMNHDKAKLLVGLQTTGKKRGDWNPIDEKIKDCKIRTVPLYHDDMQGMDRGKMAAFIIEVDGLRICHLGDCGHLLTKDQVKDIEKNGPIDVLMLPVGGVYTLNGIEAKKVQDQLKPRMYVIPMHYGTKVFDEVLSVDGFLDEQENGVVEKKATNVLEIKTDFKPPKAKVVQLHWTDKQ